MSICGTNTYILFSAIFQIRVGVSVIPTIQSFKNTAELRAAFYRFYFSLSTVTRSAPTIISVSDRESICDFYFLLFKF